MIVVDSSAVNAVLLGERDAALVLESVAGHELLCAPALLPYEVANVLAMSRRAGRIDEGEAAASLAEFTSLPWAFESQCTASALAAIGRLCASRALTAYDAAYIELASRRSCPLVTFDDAMRKAARAEGVQVLPRLRG